MYIVYIYIYMYVYTHIYIYMYTIFHLKKNLLRKNVLSPFPFSAPIFRWPFSGPSPAFLRSYFPLASSAAKMMKVSASLSSSLWISLRLEAGTSEKRPFPAHFPAEKGFSYFPERTVLHFVFPFPILRHFPVRVLLLLLIFLIF